MRWRAVIALYALQEPGRKVMDELAKGWALLHAAGEGGFGPEFRCQFEEPVATSLMELCRARVCSFSQIFNSYHFIIIINDRKET